MQGLYECLLTIFETSGEAVRARLKRDLLRAAVKATAGAWRAEDYPEFATSEMVVEWVRARRAEVTDPEPEEPEP